ncbi:hypothetical protein [Mumia flava]|nr:hypothetical protein [Mumia flava]
MGPNEMQAKLEASRAAEARAARLAREHDELRGPLAKAAERGLGDLMDSVHATLGPYFHAVAPFRGSLAFFDSSSRAVLRVRPDGHPDGLPFEIDLLATATALRLDTGELESALPALAPTSTAGWYAGVLGDDAAIAPLRGLLGGREAREHAEHIQAAIQFDAMDDPFLP